MNPLRDILKVLQPIKWSRRIMVLQGSRATIGFTSIHYDNGRVPGDRVAQFNAGVSRAKPYLDINRSKLAETIDSCVAITNSVVIQQSTRGLKMWGKTFTELVDETSASGRSTLGNNNPPAKPEVFRLRPPQRGPIAIDEKQTHQVSKMVT